MVWPFFYANNDDQPCRLPGLARRCCVRWLMDIPSSWIIKKISSCPIRIVKPGIVIHQPSFINYIPTIYISKSKIYHTYTTCFSFETTAEVALEHSNFPTARQGWTARLGWNDCWDLTCNN
jgi:hypothetical protein